MLRDDGSSAWAEAEADCNSGEDEEDDNGSNDELGVVVVGVKFERCGKADPDDVASVSLESTRPTSFHSA